MEEVSGLVWSKLARRRLAWRDCRLGRPLDCTVLRQTLGMGCGVCSVPVPSRWVCYRVVQLVESNGTCQDGPTNRVQWAVGAHVAGGQKCSGDIAAVVCRQVQSWVGGGGEGGTSVARGPGGPHTRLAFLLRLVSATRRDGGPGGMPKAASDRTAPHAETPVPSTPALYPPRLRMCSLV